MEDIRACTGQNIWLTRSRQSLSLLRPGYLQDQSGNSWDREQQFKEEQARAIRAERDAHLSPEERLERTAALCRQLALIRPVDQR